MPTPIHEESVPYTSRAEFDADMAIAYPMASSSTSVMTETRAIGDHVVAEWNHLTHSGKIYVLDELSNAKLGAYHRAAMHQTLDGTKNRTAGMSKAIIRLAGANKPLIKEGEEEVDEAFNPDKKDPRGGDVGISSGPGPADEKFNVYFKPTPSGSGRRPGHSVAKTVSKHATLEDAQAAAKAFAKKHGYTLPASLQEGEGGLVKPQAVPATDGKAQELAEAQETRRFIAWAKDISKAIAVVSRDEEEVRQYAATHFKASAFGINVLDAALKTQLGQYGVPKELWAKAKGDVILAESKAGEVVYGAWRVGHSVQCRREKVVGKITGAARGPASGTKWVTVDDGAKTHTLPAAELTPAPGWGWPSDDGEQAMKESASAADALIEAIEVLGEATAKNLGTAALAKILKEAEVPVDIVDSAYAGCDADICHYFVTVEAGDLFGVVGIRLMAMESDISVLSFDTDASSVSEEKEAAVKAMEAAAKKPITEGRVRADAELFEAMGVDPISLKTYIIGDTTPRSTKRKAHRFLFKMLTPAPGKKTEEWENHYQSGGTRDEAEKKLRDYVTTTLRYKILDVKYVGVIEI